MKDKIKSQLLNFNYTQIFSFKSFQSLYGKLQANIKEICAIYDSFSTTSCNMRDIIRRATKICSNETEIASSVYENLDLLVKMYMYYYMTENKDMSSRLYEK